MKTLFVLVSSLLLLVACSDNETTQVYDPPQPAETPNISVIVPLGDGLYSYDSMEIEYSGDTVSAYPLPQFIESFLPHLFEYELVSNDDDGNWSPRFSGMPDLVWNLFEKGYLIPEKQHRAFFPSEEIVNTYNVKFMGYINMYRRVDVVRDGEIIPFQINSLETISIQEHPEMVPTQVIPLEGFISDYVTTDKTSFTYLLEFQHGDPEILSWDELREHHWSVGSEDIYKLQGSNQLVHKFSMLTSITLVAEGRRGGAYSSLNYIVN